MTRDWASRRVVGSLILVVCGLIYFVGCGSAPVAAPTSYASYNSPGGTFALEYPEGWQANGGGKRGLEWAKITSGPTGIHLDTGVAASLMGDIAGSLSGSDGQELPPELEPIHEVHMAGLEAAQKEYSGYKEVGEPAVLDVRLGPARTSEFTASTTFGGGLHGYRTTILGHDKSVHVVCFCPESDWKTLQPAFDHVLSTLKRGQEE